MRELAAFAGGVYRHPSPPGVRLRALGRFGYRQAHKRLRRGRPLLVPWEGMTLEVPPDANSAAANYYFGRQDWWEFAFLERFLRPGDLAVDVGANVGAYTLFLAKLVGPAGEVIACEPDPRNLERLRANVERNGLRQVEIEALAIGAAPGEVNFATGLDSIGHVASEGAAGSLRVPVTTLDALCARRRPAFIKVDVEGFEPEVVAGANELMTAGVPLAWQLELLRERPAESGRAASLLERAGFRLCVYDIRTNTLRRRDWQTARGNNLLAIRDVEAVTSRIREERP